MILLVTYRQKEALVIKLTDEWKTTRYIAQAIHISLKDIGRICRKTRGEEYFEEGATISLNAFKCLKTDNALLDV